MAIDHGMGLTIDRRNRTMTGSAVTGDSSPLSVISELARGRLSFMFVYLCIYNVSKALFASTPGNPG